MLVNALKVVYYIIGSFTLLCVVDLIITNKKEKNAKKNQSPCLTCKHLVTYVPNSSRHYEQTICDKHSNANGIKYCRDYVRRDDLNEQ